MATAPAPQSSARPMELRLRFDSSWLDVTIMVMACVILLNIILALVLDKREAGFKLIPMWVILISLCMVAKGQLALGMFVGLAICLASEFTCYFDKEWSVKMQKIWPVAIADLSLLFPLCLLASTKTETLTSQRDREQVANRKANEDLIRIQETLRSKRAGDGKKESAQQIDKAVMLKKNMFELYQQAYKEIFGVRYKRDVPKVLEALFVGRLSFPSGIILEMSEDGKEAKIRNFWGVAPAKTDPMTAIAAHKDGLIQRRAVDRKEPMLEADFKKDMDLMDAHARFSAELFPLVWVIPVVAGERTAMVAYLSAQPKDAPLPFELSLARPLLAATGMAIVRISTKEARPSFSSFLPGR